MASSFIWSPRNMGALADSLRPRNRSLAEIKNLPNNRIALEELLWNAQMSM